MSKLPVPGPRSKPVVQATRIDIVNALPPFTSMTLPAGTRLLVRTVDGISSQDRAGKRFLSRLEGDLIVDGVRIAPRGAEVYGRIEESKQANAVAGRSNLEITLSDLMVENELRPILTVDIAEKGKSEAFDTTKKVGVATGVGALAGGGDGAKVGAAVGAGAALVTKGEVLNIPGNSLLEFRLSAPLAVRIPTERVSQANAASTVPLVSIPAGTFLPVRLAEPIGSQDRPGKRFTAILESDIAVNGTIILPRGTNVYGRLEEARSSGNLAGRSAIEMTLTDVLLGSELRPIATSDYAEKGKNTAVGSALTVGIGAGIGALIDGGDGARKGAAVGLGVAAITKGEQLNVPTNTLLEFRLATPLTVRRP